MENNLTFFFYSKNKSSLCCDNFKFVVSLSSYCGYRSERDYSFRVHLLYQLEKKMKTGEHEILKIL